MIYHLTAFSCLIRLEGNPLIVASSNGFDCVQYLGSVSVMSISHLLLLGRSWKRNEAPWIRTSEFIIHEQPIVGKAITYMSFQV